ncbi:chemotaxis protein CheC [Fusobacterium sp. MFO224]|uniref:chemotaxis protein CheC n=1 Tax=Fusobacterium sp. MFO224 TaxID=3378070 RepID=UPI003854AD80
METLLLTKLQENTLQEIANISTGHAANSLAKLMDKKIKHNIPFVSVIQLENIFDLIENPEDETYMIALEISGDVKGVILMLMDEEGANLISKYMTKKMLGEDIEEMAPEDQKELKFSVLVECINIIGNSYLTTLMNVTKLKIESGLTDIAIDMKAAVLDRAFLKAGATSYSDLIYIKSELYLTDENYINKNFIGEIVIVPNFEEKDRIMEGVGI